MKKTVTVIMANFLIASALLAGCSGTNDASKQQGPKGTTENSKVNSEEKKDAPVTLVLWNRIQTDLFDRTVAEFHKKYPNITIKVENLPSAGADVPQYQAAITSNELPDMFVRPTGYSLTQLVALDKVHDLNEVFPANIQNRFTDGTFSEGISMVGGKVYQFPLYSSLHGTLVMYYNKKVISELGYKESDIPKTWDQLNAFGKDIQQKSNGKKYALVFGAKTNYMSTFLANQLSPPISPEMGWNSMNYKTGQYNWDTSGMNETMKYLKDAYDSKVLHPSTIDADTGKSYTLMKSGETAFVFGGNWSGGALADPAEGAAKFTNNDWGVVPIPTKDGKNSLTYFEGGSGESLSVAKNTKHWPEVKLFLEFAREYVYADIVKQGGTLPSRLMDDIKVEAPFAQYNTIADLMMKTKVLTPSVYVRNPGIIDVMAKFESYKPRENVGTILLGYMSGQFKDVSAELKKLSVGFNGALDKAIGETNGKVKKEDFIFSDWVPGKPYKK
jgi:raffinose/stachyose/melibiose transport system substrate-binding protein